MAKVIVASKGNRPCILWCVKIILITTWFHLSSIHRFALNGSAIKPITGLILLSKQTRVQTISDTNVTLTAMKASHSFDGCLSQLGEDETVPTEDPLERARDKPTSLDSPAARRLKSGAMTLGRLPQQPSFRIDIKDKFVFDRPNSVSTNSLDHIPSPAKQVRYCSYIFSKCWTENYGIIRD